MKEAFPFKNLEVVFGCGGDRDRLKRPLMGEAVSSFATKIWLTSDNPRSEDPLRIIEDIERGIHDKSIVISNPDRKQTIANAMFKLADNDMLLIAGKGHENYIEIHGIKYPYSDLEEVEKNIKAKT